MSDYDAKNVNQKTMFFIFDSRLFILLLFFILSWSLTMLYIIIAVMVFFSVLNWFDITPEMFFRLLRRKVVSGGKLLARLPWQDQR